MMIVREKGMYQVLQPFVQPCHQTIGTGNIVGVATAIKTGGPGALWDVDSCFWYGN